MHAGRNSWNIHNKPAEVSRLADIAVVQLFFKHKWFQFNARLRVCAVCVCDRVDQRMHLVSMCAHGHTVLTDLCVFVQEHLLCW